jgi:Restriction endonuclease
VSAVPPPAYFEQQAASAMRAWGHAGATATSGGPDSGIDVAAAGAVAQVKAWTKAAGRPDVQRLVGAAPKGKAALFFSLSGFTPQAIAYANERGVALFTFTDLEGAVRPENDAARRAMNRRSRDPDVVAREELDQRDRIREQRLARYLSVLLIVVYLLALVGVVWLVLSWVSSHFLTS